MLKTSLLIIFGLVVFGNISYPSKALAGTNIQVNICSTAPTPLVFSPVSGSSTSASDISIIGRSEAGLTIEGSDNGNAFGSVIVAPDNTFYIIAPLQLGSNNLMITANNPCGPSDAVAITVYRTAVVQPPAQAIVYPIQNKVGPSQNKVVRPSEQTIVSPIQNQNKVGPSKNKASQPPSHTKPHRSFWSPSIILWLIILILIIIIICLLIIYKRIRRRAADSQQ